MKTYWIIKAEETLPFETDMGRLGRAGQFGEIIHNNINHVVRWASTYEHIEKQYRYNETSRIEHKKNYDVILLHSKKGYRKNISLRRIRYSQDLGLEFRRGAKQESKPDMIYCSYPLIDLAYEAVCYGMKHNIPVVIDIRDLWPDIFVQPFPKFLQPFVSLGINLLFKRKVSYVMRYADAVVGVVPKTLEFAKKHGRTLRPHDHVVYLSYDSTPADEDELKKAFEFWESKGLKEGQLIVSFISSLNKRLNDFDTLINAAKQLESEDIKFVFCGTGNYFDELKAQTNDLSNIVLPGYRNRTELQALLKLSTFGLIPIFNTEDFIDALPNKFGEYLSEGLIVLTSLKGLSRSIVESEQCGFYYEDTNTLVKIISELKNNPSKTKAMKENALNLFYKDFDASVVYTGFYTFLETLASKGK